MYCIYLLIFLAFGLYVRWRLHCRCRPTSREMMQHCKQGAAQSARRGEFPKTQLTWDERKNGQKDKLDDI